MCSYDLIIDIVSLKAACVFKLPFTAALVPGLADLFLMALSATGSSSTSFSARELRLLGPLGFSTAALRGPERKTTNDKEGQHKDALLKMQGCALTLLYSEKDIIPLRTAVFPRLPQITCVFIPTASAAST